MTQGERVKKLRKELGLTLEKFGQPLGVRKTTISEIENDKNNLTEQMALAICRTYDVRREWLVDGVGEMWIEKTLDEEIAEFLTNVTMEGDEGFKHRLVAALAHLDADGWKALEGLIEEMGKDSEN